MCYFLGDLLFLLVHAAPPGLGNIDLLLESIIFCLWSEAAMFNAPNSIDFIQNGKSRIHSEKGAESSTKGKDPDHRLMISN